MTYFDRSAYLHRLGLTENVTADLQTLEMLTRVHLKAIPFENLEITEEYTEPSLEPDALFDKIIRRRRGGYCFELNKLFGLLLKDIGFECYSVAARVIHGRREPCPLSHRAVITVVDGKRYLCDVGFGGAGPKGIVSMETEEVQSVAGELFTVRQDQGSYVISLVQEGIAEPVLRVHNQPWLDVDFDTLNRYYATYPRSPFRLKRILYRCTEDGWYSLVDTLLTTCHHGIKTTRRLESEEDIRHVIAERFGLQLQ